jgi:hypothetical protein
LPGPLDRLIDTLKKGKIGSIRPFGDDRRVTDSAEYSAQMGSQSVRNDFLNDHCKPHQPRPEAHPEPGALLHFLLAEIVAVIDDDNGVLYFDR